MDVDDGSLLGDHEGQQQPESSLKNHPTQGNIDFSDGTFFDEEVVSSVNSTSSRDENNDTSTTGTTNAPPAPSAPSTSTSTTNLFYIIYYEMFLFFACGVGTSLCYIGTLSGLVYFMINYGPNLYVYLNLAVYLPLLPISIFQAIYDQEYDKMYQSYYTYFFRGIFGFVLSIIGTIGVALTSATTSSSSSSSLSPVTQLLVAAVLQGIGGAILSGTLNQMTSFVMETKLLSTTTTSSSAEAVALAAAPNIAQTNSSSIDSTSSDGRRLKASLSAGVQASALIVLLISIGTGFVSRKGQNCDDHEAGRPETDITEDKYMFFNISTSRLLETDWTSNDITAIFNSTDDDHDDYDQPFQVFFYTIAILECILCIIFIILMTCHPPVAISMTRRDQSIMQSVGRHTNSSRSGLLAENGNDGNHQVNENLVEEEAEDILNALQAMMPTNIRQGLDEATQFERRSSSSADEGDSLSVPLLTEQERQVEEEEQQDMSFTELWNVSKSCCITLSITLIPSFLVGTWFTHVHTNWVILPQILFYVRIGSDLVGRIATLWIPPKSVSCLTWMSLLRLIPVASFFINASSSSLRSVSFVDQGDNITDHHHKEGSTSSDYVSIGLVSWIAFLSGYLVTGCFQLAPGLLQVAEDQMSSSPSRLPLSSSPIYEPSPSLSSSPLLPSGLSSSPTTSFAAAGEEFKDEIFGGSGSIDDKDGGNAEAPTTTTRTCDSADKTNANNTEANVAKQASLLNLAFSVAALLGLGSSFALIGLGL